MIRTYIDQFFAAVRLCWLLVALMFAVPAQAASSHVMTLHPRENAIQGKLPDTTAPTVMWDASSTQYMNGSKPVTFKVHVTDSDSGVKEVWAKWSASSSVLMTADGDGGYSTTIDASYGKRLHEGARDVQIWASDYAGNNTGWLTKGHFIVHRKAPTVYFASPVYGTHTSDTQVKVDVLSDVGIQSGTVRICWGNDNRCAGNLAMTHVSGNRYLFTIPDAEVNDGKVTIGVYAEDVAGNDTRVDGFWPRSEFTLNRVMPKVTWDESSTKYANDNDVWIIVHAAPSAMGTGGKVTQVRARWPGQPQTGVLMDEGREGVYRTKLAASEVQSMPEGENEVQIWARNFSGNDTGWISKGRFTVDHKAPTVTWDVSNTKYTNGNAVTIKVQATDGVTGVKDVWARWPGLGDTGVLMSADGEGIYRQTIDEKAARSLPEGQYDVQIWAADQAGNTTGWVSKGRFFVDRTAPTVTWDASNPKQTTDSHITLKVMATDSVSGVASVSIKMAGTSDRVVVMQRGEAGLFSATLDFAGWSLPLGLSQVEVKADDVAGNSTGWVAGGSFAILPRSNDKLALEKSVFPTTDVKPGETLYYVLRFTNLSAEPLHDLVIQDDFPAQYATPKEARCGDIAMAAGITCCVVDQESCSATVISLPDRLEWRVKGRIAPGGTGTVTYQLRVHE